MFTYYTDCLHCPNCNFKRESSSSCLTISLDLPSNLEGNTNSTRTLFASNEKDENIIDMVELLASHMKNEVLDDANAWECGQCHQHVKATKSRVYDSLPSSLVFHLNRSRYNAVSLPYCNFSKSTFYSLFTMFI